VGGDRPPSARSRAIAVWEDVAGAIRTWVPSLVGRRIVCKGAPISETIVVPEKEKRDCPFLPDHGEKKKEPRRIQGATDSQGRETLWTPKRGSQLAKRIIVQLDHNVAPQNLDLQAEGEGKSRKGEESYWGRSPGIRQGG